MATEVEILGHKAKIERVLGRAKLEPWHKEDQLVVWLKFDGDVDGVSSFGVCLPAMKYEHDEFLYHVRRRGEEELKRILKKHSEENMERAKREERQKSLDALAEEAQRLVE